MLSNGQVPLRQVRALLVPKWEIGKYWPILQNQLAVEPELWDFMHTMDGIRRLLKEGHAQLWLFGDEERPFLMLMSEVWTTEAGHKVLTFWWGRGEGLEEVLPWVVRGMKAFARQQGCDTASVVGRLGWVKRLSQYGFRHYRTEMMLSLNDGLEETQG